MVNLISTAASPLPPTETSPNRGKTIREIEAEFYLRPDTLVLRGRVIGREIVVHCPYLL